MHLIYGWQHEHYCNPQRKVKSHFQNDDLSIAFGVTIPSGNQTWRALDFQPLMIFRANCLHGI